MHLLQFAAVCKSLLSNTSYGTPDGYGGQAAAIRESIVSDGSHGIGDGYGGQAAATTESRASDGCYGENYNSLEIISLPQFGW